MKLIFIIGNAAVGKMTVGQELMKITDLRLFHNHMTIEPIIEVFGYYDGQTISKVRQVIFEEFAKSKNDGLIFTYMWAFDQPADWAYVEKVSQIFKSNDADVYYIELVTSQQVRLARNETENRLKHKASKRAIHSSKERLIKDDENYRCESFPNEITYENYLRIDNTDLSAMEVAEMIKNNFNL